MKVTLDINELLDVFQKREPHHVASAQVVCLVTAGTLAGRCPAHGLTTLHYLVCKRASKAEAEGAMELVLRPFQIGNLEAARWQTWMASGRLRPRAGRRRSFLRANRPGRLRISKLCR